jgi:signal transduction histidine kinase
MASPEMAGSDTDSQEQQIRALQREVERLRTSAEDCSKVIYHLIHDLRGPVRTMLTHAQLLERRHPGIPSLKEYLETIYEGAREAAAVLDGSSAFFKVNLTASPTSVNLRLPVDLALMQLQKMVDEVQAHIEIRELPEASVDLQLMAKVFEHLIRNALLYRRQSEPLHVLISGTEFEDHVEVSVEDNGQGIPQAKLEEVFQPFVREHGRGYPGVGLGLSIARKYVVAHNGTIRAESNGSTGSSFLLSIPL